MSGPMHGIRAIEFAGIGAAPFAAMMLSDMGADVVRIDRADAVQPSVGGPSLDILNRGRRSIALDLKHPAAPEAVLRLVEGADVLIEGFRPGVAERLGFGPDVCLARNGRLVYGRMTGWGQEGPYAKAAGHDVNFIALAGALDSLGREGEDPFPPLNLVGDFGGGAMFLAFGIVAALLEVSRSGEGQVVDAAMVDGAASLMTMFHGYLAMGAWQEERGTNALDTGSHFYEVYETADGKFVSIGSIEPRFYSALLAQTGLAGDGHLPDQMDRAQWKPMKERLRAIFLLKTRDEWCEIMEGHDVCFAPVLSLREAPYHPHNRERETFVNLYGVVQPAPAPRFSRSACSIQRPPAHPGEHSAEVLESWGFSASEIWRLQRDGAMVNAGGATPRTNGHEAGVD